MSGLYTAGIAVIIGGGMATGKGPAGALKPKAPTPQSAPMPDQSEILRQQQLQESKDAAARYGRAATILSNNPGSGTGTSDKLGP